MKYRPNSVATLFQEFKSGNTEAFGALANLEGGRIYDYVMRMTGNIECSRESVSDTIIQLENDCHAFETLEETLVALYKNARRLAQQFWNAETLKLENSSYDVEKSVEKDLPILKKLELVLRSLEGQKREIILLRERYGFALDEVAEIISQAPSDVEILFAQGLNQVESHFLPRTDVVPEMFCRLLNYQPPDVDHVTTQNLSHLMSDFRKSGEQGIKPFKIGGIILILFCLAAFSWTKRVEIATWIHQISGKMIEEKS